MRARWSVVRRNYVPISGDETAAFLRFLFARSKIGAELQGWRVDIAGAWRKRHLVPALASGRARTGEGCLAFNRLHAVHPLSVFGDACGEVVVIVDRKRIQVLARDAIERE